MLAPAIHQLINCMHSLAFRVGLPFLDRVFPLLLIAVIVTITALMARHHGQTSRS